MASVKEMFNTVVGKAIQNAELIETSKDKAMAYAAIAQALALTGKVGNDVTVAEVESKPPKNADKMKRQPQDLAPEEMPKEEKKPIKKEEKVSKKKEETPKFTEEWTEEAMEHFADELTYIDDFTQSWTEEGLNECLKEFSSGVLKSMDDVNPMNINAVVEYLKSVVAEEEANA